MLEKLRQKFVLFAEWALPLAALFFLWLFKHRADEYQQKLAEAERKNEDVSNSNRLNEIATMNKQVENDKTTLAQKETKFRDTLKRLDD